MIPDEEWVGPILDAPAPEPVLASVPAYAGHVWSVRKDTLSIHGHQVERDLLIHPGAVAVMAQDDDGRILLIRQYRHPIAMFVFEPPAGLLDVPDEDPLLTAQRELAEEAGYQASRWDVLVDFFNSPGGSSEAIRVYLARDLSPLPGGRVSTGEAEEAYLPRAWIDLREAVSLVMSGAVGSPTAVLGVLALQAATEQPGLLRPGTSPWAPREWLLAQGRVHQST